jgi:hypothetical protein
MAMLPVFILAIFFHKCWWIDAVCLQKVIPGTSSQGELFPWWATRLKIYCWPGNCSGTKGDNLVASAAVHLSEVLAFDMDRTGAVVHDLSKLSCRQLDGSTVVFRNPGCSLVIRNPLGDNTVMLYRAVIWTAKLRTRAHLARATNDKSSHSCAPYHYVGPLCGACC